MISRVLWRLHQIQALYQISSAGLEIAFLLALEECTTDASTQQDNVYNMKPEETNPLYEPGYRFYWKLIKKRKKKKKI